MILAALSANRVCRVRRRAVPIKSYVEADLALFPVCSRGTDTINLYKYFETLRSQAQSSGGEFHSLLGNHEYMNALSDWRYVTPADIATFGGLERRREALTPEGLLGKTWLAK